MIKNRKLVWDTWTADYLFAWITRHHATSLAAFSLNITKENTTPHAPLVISMYKSFLVKYCLYNHGTCCTETFRLQLSLFMGHSSSGRVNTPFVLLWRNSAITGSYVDFLRSAGHAGVAATERSTTSLSGREAEVGARRRLLAAHRFIVIIFGRPEVERRRVDAVTPAGGLRAVGEQVAQMGPTIGAAHLRPH